MNVVIYCRYSPRPVKKGEAESVAAAEDAATMKLQIDVCQRYAVMKELTVSDIIRDPETSARKEALFEREGGSRLKDLPRGSQIICSKLDRMFRDTADGLMTIRYFKQRGVTLHIADQSGCTLDVSTGEGEFLLTVLLGTTALEPRRTADRTSRGMKHRQEHGQRMTRPGYEPYGKMVDPANPANLIDHPDEVRVIELIRKLHSEGHDFSVIASDLNSAGIPHRSSRWKAQYVKRIVARAISS